MTRVNAGSVPQNCRAISRAAAVHRLWPSMMWTESPGRMFRSTASLRDRPTSVMTGAGSAATLNIV